MASLTCDIVTPAEKLFTAECYMVTVPGAEGDMGFLPGHAQLMSTLADGVVRVYSDASTLAHTYALQGGYVQVTGSKVIVLADRAMPVDAIDVEDVRARLADAQAALGSAEGADAALLEGDIAWYKVLEAAAGK